MALGRDYLKAVFKSDTAGQTSKGCDKASAGAGDEGLKSSSVG
jgi:hypothetical protein